MRIGICHDCIEQRQEIIAICNMYFEEQQERYEFVEFTSIKELMSYQEELMLLLISIDLAGYSGDAVRQFLESNRKIFRIGMLSEHEEPVYKGYGIRGLGVLTKPWNPEKLHGWMITVIKEYEDDGIIHLDKTNAELSIHFSELVYIEWVNYRHVKIVTTQKEYVVKGSVRKWIHRIHNNRLRRSHSMYAVNLEYVNRIDGEVCLDNGYGNIPLARKYKKSIEKMFRLYQLFIIKERL